jgi:hypothetical protein
VSTKIFNGKTGKKALTSEKFEESKRMSANRIDRERTLHERAGPAIETPGVVDDKNKTLFMFGMLPNISPWI